jgi:hypothetical protein
MFVLAGFNVRGAAAGVSRRRACILPDFQYELFCTVTF